jgi:hypothetical protein
LWKKIETGLRYSLLLIILGIFVLVNLGFTQVMAADLETSTTVLADKGNVGSGEIIHFLMWTYMGFDSVAFGQIRLTDTFTGAYITTTITNGTATVDWLVPSPIQSGEHIFLAEYLGFSGYLPSNGSCVVIFEEISPGSTRSTSLLLGVNSTTVYKNASIHFTLTLFIHYRWWFQGGFLTVTNVNLTGSPVIYTYGPLENYYPGTDPAILTLEFDYEIPVFSEIGASQFYASYTGSSQSQTTPCSSNLVNVTVLSSGYWLTQDINATKVQRTEESVLINTTILGDNPSGLTLSIFYKIDIKQIIIAKKVVVDRNIRTLFFPNSSLPLGDLIIFTELRNEISDDLYAYTSSSTTIQDRARIQSYLNSTDYRQNETILLEAYITLEDIHTVPVICQVELRDLTEGNISLMNKSTNSNGFVSFTYSLTEDNAVGNHEFVIAIFDLEPNILKVSTSILVPIKGLIEFDLTYESGGILRNTNTQIQVTVLSGGIVINEGLVSFMYNNYTIIDTQSCIAGLVFNYYISHDHPLGDTYLLIAFHDSDNYDEEITTFKITVLSVPHFDSLNQNSTELSKGQSGRFWGYILDEDGEAVINEVIHFTDTTTGEYLGFVLSDAEGLFFYDYVVSETSQIGVHILQCDYQGNIGAFYLPTVNPGIFSIIVRPALSLMVEEVLLANHYSVLELKGGLNEDISLHWQRDGSAVWDFIAVVSLNASGIGNYNWTTPYYKGGLSLRASNLNNTSFKFDHTFMHSIANIEVIGDGIGNVNSDYHFTINCTEIYQIWIDGLLWKDWIPSGKHSYLYSFSSRGIREIIIISNDTYVFYKVYQHQVTIYEDLIVSVSVPQEALVNMSINIDGTVIGEVSGPITGIDAILQINEVEREIDSTNGAGMFDFLISFDHPGIYTVSVKVPLQIEDYYNTSFSTQFSIIIHSLPSNIEIISPTNNSSYGAIIELSFHGDAENYWYFIEPLDLMNTSWVDTVYRELPEGDYTCHVYGENSYGILSYASSSFRIDITAPSLIVTSPRNESYNTNTVLLSYLTNADDVRIFLDGSTIIKSSGTSLTELSEGDHNLTILVRDTVGNFVVRSSIFKVDTVAPFLTVYSPYNRSYIEKVPLTLDSDGQLVLYYITDVHSTNLTFKSSIQLYLPIGSYSLNIYSFDSAGNVKTEQIDFSMVEKIDLLVNSHLTVVNPAGNYLLSTEILSNPNFDQVGFYLNGSHFGLLTWDPFHQDYRIALQLPSPGNWEISLYARTIDERYDFREFLEIWSPSKPIVTSLSVSWESNYYELRTTIDSQSLDLDLVQISLDETNYSLNNFFGDQWYVQVYINPQNYTLNLNIWYPWDNEPSISKEFDILWYAPQIIVVDSRFERNGFDLEIRIEKVNASISNDIPVMILEGLPRNYSVNGNLVYESAIGSYQIWHFTSPWLAPDMWNYSLSISDIYGQSNQFFGVFNSTDSPPEIGDLSLTILDNTSTGVLFRISVQVIDDYDISDAILYINGVEYSFTLINNSYITLDFFLTPGLYVLHLSVVDDVNHETAKWLTNLHIQSTTNLTTTTELIDLTNQSTQTSHNYTQQKLKSPSGISGLVEVGLGTSLFATLVALANSIFRKKRSE